MNTNLALYSFLDQIWTEYNEKTPIDKKTSSVNFLPGMGGFLQSLVYGFAGVRIRPDIIEFHNPLPPPGASRLVLHGFSYLGSNLTIVVDDSQTTIQVNSIQPELPLVLRKNESGSVERVLIPGMNRSALQARVLTH